MHPVMSIVLQYQKVFETDLEIHLNAASVVQQISDNEAGFARPFEYYNVETWVLSDITSYSFLQFTGL